MPHSPAPEDLGGTGKKLWTTIVEDLPDAWEFSQRELVWLRMACDQADDLARVEQLIEENGAETKGSTGQSVVNPALIEARQMRAAIDRLIGRLALPDDEGVGRTSASERGSKAANARWGRGAA